MHLPGSSFDEVYAPEGKELISLRLKGSERNLD